MKIRKNNTQQLAAAKSSISERSARRIESSVTLPSQNPRRYWRSRPDPFAQVWDTEVVPLLQRAPKLMAITLLRKPQAFTGLAFRDALFPREAYRQTWEQLDRQLPQRQACQTMVALLEMAARDGIEGVLAERLEELLVVGALPDVKALREEVAPRKTELPQITVVMPAASVYDALLPGASEDEPEEVAA